ncbi:MAG: cytochrome c-type biogenesis protein CcmH [Chloroflexi bacterium]|nr:cytochrome c-type biogenesis protein CcmH [Chloroflexota bacterium]
MRFLRIFLAAVFLFILTIAPAFADAGVDAVAQNLMCQCGCTMVLSTCECGTAEQMRSEITTLFAEGKTQQQILDFYVAKYGEKVLSAPTKQGFNLTAYITPFAAILIAGGAIFLVVRQWVIHSRKAPPVAPALTPEPTAAHNAGIVSLDALRARMQQDLARYGE